MFFKKKCPNCGAKNPKERMTCAECGAPLTLGQVERQVTEVPLEAMEDIESTTLCGTCRKELECFQKGICELETCNQYEPLPPDELLERDSCPECGSKNIHDCKNSPLLEDDTIGQCLDCGIYWCLECGYVFESVEEGMECPHWEICADCSDEHGYLDWVEFMETICPTCEYYDDSCQLEDTLQCDKQWQLLCPYEGDVSKCPRVEQKTSSADSQKIGGGYVKYIPGKCTYCGSSNVSETLKRTIKGAIVDGYLWDIRCADCGSKWIALEKPDFQ